MPETRSFRSDGRLRVTEDVADVHAAVVEAARDALDHEGSIGVLVPDAVTETVTAALWNAGLTVGAGRLSVMPVSMVKGLEYDHVIVVEPADIVEAETRGLNRLYVALTRAVSRLDVISSRSWSHHR